MGVELGKVGVSSLHKSLEKSMIFIDVQVLAKNILAQLNSPKDVTGHDSSVGPQMS